MAAPQSNQIQDIENNFTKGLITEFTGLNFPADAATDTNNCVYTLVGDVTRRAGIDFEVNHGNTLINRTDVAVSSYKWNNVGGTGIVQLVVTQAGDLINFWNESSSTVSSPLSTQLSGSSINMSNYTAAGGTFDATQECQYADGNGYLFVFHPSCDTIYCTYVGGTITANRISIQIRDFVGIPEPGVAVTTRPASLSNEHQYNITNQGWTSGSAWTALSNTTFSSGSYNGNLSFTVASGLSITGGDTVNIYCADATTTVMGLATTVVLSGVVASYSSTTLVITLSYSYGGIWTTFSHNDWTLVQTNLGHITTWFSDIGNYPSNADVWWYFKDTSDLFNPTTTVSNITLSSSNAARGHYVLNAFNQQRGLVSSIGSLTDITTTVRPRTGAWFQGRVWYTGVDDQQSASGDEPYYTWSENIYFSQIIQTSDQFGLCYQINDPTSENLFDLLPTDGGVIQIPGCGPIYKLFPMQNAMLIFAANGVWYITGSQGIGFSANDYTIVKLSAVRSISSTSFVDINGLPMFWNEEGIYKVESAKQGTSLLNSPLHVNPLEVNSITVGTILTFYNNIPIQSKKYAHAAYDPIGYVVQWIYKTTVETSVTDRYAYDGILSFNTFNNAFYPYTVDNSNSCISGIVYVSGPGGTDTPDPSIKYVVTYPSGNTFGYTFADEHDTTYVDWASYNSVNYSSYFITGYKIQGQGQRRFQVPYIFMYSRLDQPVSYYIQSIWDFATSANSGRWSSKQQVNIFNPNYGMVFKKHRMRGRGLVLQIKVSSVDGQPFDIMGWSGFEIQNLGI